MGRLAPSLARLERLWLHLRQDEFNAVFPGDVTHAQPNVQRFISRELSHWDTLGPETAENLRTVMGFIDGQAQGRAHMMVKLMLYASSPSNA